MISTPAEPTVALNEFVAGIGLIENPCIPIAGNNSSTPPEMITSPVGHDTPLLWNPVFLGIV